MVYTGDSCYTTIMRKRSWSTSDLIAAAKKSTSVRQVLQRLGLAEAGGNYAQVKRTLLEQRIDVGHFLGQGHNKGKKLDKPPVRTLASILVAKSEFQSYKLKKRLFKAGLKEVKCERCGWCEISQDGRTPLELNHINGDRFDNRIENLRVLCPNCHSLQPTHRGLNKKKG